MSGKTASRLQTAAILGLAACLVVLGLRLLPKEYLEMRGNILAAYSFDGTLDRVVPDRAEPRIVAPGGRYEAGRVGQGLYLPDGVSASLVLPPEWNLAETGMISFWMKPDSDAVNGRFERVLLIPDGGFSLHKSREARLVFRIGSKMVLGPARWAGGHWNHVAIGWARRADLAEGTMEMYLNGRRVETVLGPGDGRMPAGRTALSLRLGGPPGTGFRGTLDELMVFNRLLNEKEVRTIYGRGLSAKDVARVKDLPLADPLVNLAAGKPVTGSATELSKDFEYRRFTDGDTHVSSRAVNGPDGTGREFAQVDLGAALPFNEVQLWHGSRGRYRHDRLEASATGEFRGEESVLFDSDHDGEYEERPEGRTFRFPTIRARYLRNWLGGEASAGTNAWVEIQAFHDPTPYPPTVEPAAQATPLDRPAQVSDPVAVFVPPTFADLDAATLPRADWLGKPVRVEGAWGDQVPRAFAVRAQRAVRDVRGTVEAVLDGEGRPVADLTLHVLRPRERRRPEGGGVPGPLANEMLVKDDRAPLRNVFPTTGDFPEVPVFGDVRTDLEAGQTKAFWLTAAIASHAPPGVYRTSARLEAPGGFQVSVPIEVEVLPLDLAKPRNRFWALAFSLHLADGPRARLDARQRSAEFPYVPADAYGQYLRDAAAHGFDVLAFLQTEQAFTGPDCPLARAALLARDAGFTRGVMLYRDWWAGRGDPGGRQFGTDLAGYTRALVDFQRRVGLPSPVLYEEEEPAERAAGDVEGRRPVIVENGGSTAATIAGGHLDRFVDRVDIPILQPGSPLKARWAAESIRARKKSPWYSLATGAQDAEETRRLAGYGFWARNFDGLLAGPYLQVVGDPFDDRDGPGADRGMSYPSRRGPIDTRAWEAARAGVDDYRAVHSFTLQARALVADLKDDPARLDALETSMDAVWDAVLRQVEQGPGADFEADRRTVLDAILAIQGLRAAKQIAPAAAGQNQGQSPISGTGNR